MLRKSTGNMYAWVDFTWNPIKGACPYNCGYCYTRRWGDLRPLLHLDERELRVDLMSGNCVFVCSGCDLFHPDISKVYPQKNLRRLLPEHRLYGREYA
jgi:protein gp37